MQLQYFPRSAKGRCARLILAAAASLLPLAAAQAQTAAATNISTVEEVVITANKRAENILKVPETVTSLSGAELQTKGIEHFADLVLSIPSLTSVNAGAPGHGQLVIRGITTGTGQSAPTVSIYLDDVPFTSTSPINGAGAVTFDPDLADIDHVEVLEGPQSTLYGASSMGGIIKYVTKRPSLTDYEGDVSISGTAVDNGGDGYAVKGTVNIPLIQDKVGLRITAVDRFDPGWVDNVLTHQSDTNWSRTDGARISLRIDPTDNISSTFNILSQKTTGGNFSYEYLNPNTQQRLYGKYDVSNYFNAPYNTSYLSIANTTNANFSFATLINTASYAKTSDYEVRDYTPAYGILIPTVDQPAAVQYTALPVSDRITDEVRLQSKPGALEWLVGGFFTHEWDTYGVQERGESVPGFNLLPGAYGNIYTYAASPTYDEQSAFGDLTYHWGTLFDLSAGARVSTNEQKFDVVRSGLLGASPLLGASHDSAVTYAFTGSYHPTQQLTLYLRAASAYRPGSTQPVTSPAIPAEYGPDSLWNYEGGVKGQWWNGRVTATASVYHIDWSHIQLTDRIGGFNVITNAGNATVDGAELELTVKPTKGLTLQYSGATTDAQLRSNDAVIGASSGNPLPFTAKYNHTMNADYVFPLSDDAKGNVGLTYIYQGDRHTAFPGDPLNTDEHLPAYQTASARVGVSWSRYWAELRIDNLTDVDAITSEAIVRRVTGQNVPAVATVLQPRTATMTIGARF